MSSPSNPYASFTDATRLAVIGHSSGASVVSHLQLTDVRVDTAVAWDGLSPDWTPRVPALGLSSDISPPPPGPPDRKLAGAQAWMAAGVPTGELTIAGTNHNSFQTNGDPAFHPTMLYATLAWLDRYLGGDTTAISRLANPTWDGEPRVNLLSSYYTSLVSTPEYTCLDLDTC
jgi:hypothetical protein